MPVTLLIDKEEREFCIIFFNAGQGASETSGYIRYQT